MALFSTRDSASSVPRDPDSTALTVSRSSTSTQSRRKAKNQASLSQKAQRRPVSQEGEQLPTVKVRKVERYSALSEVENQRLAEPVVPVLDPVWEAKVLT